MRTSALVALLALLAAAPALGANDPMPTLRLAPGSTLQVSGTATIGSFTCRTREIRLEPAAELGGGMQSADLRVPAKKLDCGNRIINSHMRATLRADENPDVALRLSFPESAWESLGEEVLLAGTLVLGGDSQPVTVRATVGPGEDGTLRIRGSHALLLSDHGLTTPSFLLKLLTVHDRVTVRFDLSLAR